MSSTNSSNNPRCGLRRLAAVKRAPRVSAILHHACAAGLLLLLAGCDRTPRPVPADSVSAGVPTISADSLHPPAGTGWVAEAGPFLVLPSVEGGEDAGSLIRPEATELTVGDTTGLGNAGLARVELFSRGALVGEASLTIQKASPLDSGCTAWPVAHFNATPGLAPGSGTLAGAPRGWTAAFVKGRVTLVPLDSIEGLSSRDSAGLAANVSRLASGLADDTVMTFRGLPFVVLRAYRGKLNGTSFVVATLVRRVNQEDAPQEERLVLVIDGEPDDAKGWTVGWHERASGREDELVVAEPLLAFTLPSAGNPHLLFGRDDGEALSAALLVRQGAGWRVLWESALAGCDR